MILSSILAIDPAKLKCRLDFLMECFRAVLDEAGEHSLAERLP
jgi:hypothetical protein